MSTGYRTRLGKAFKIKDGRLIRTNTYKDVSARLRERGSKKVRVVQRCAISTVPEVPPKKRRT